jgi:hypothetical protein
MKLSFPMIHFLNRNINLVKDADGKPLQAAKVLPVHGETDRRRSTLADASGFEQYPGAGPSSACPFKVATLPF